MSITAFSRQEAPPEQRVLNDAWEVGKGKLSGVAERGQRFGTAPAAKNIRNALEEPAGTGIGFNPVNRADGALFADDKVLPDPVAHP